MANEIQPHQQRVLDEKEALDDKLTKLIAFFSTKIYDELTMQEQELLKLQSSYMQSYSNILAERIALFKDLPA